MLGIGKRKPVSERAAEGETERVYYEIKQVLRVTGVNLNFRTWASYGNWLPTVWYAMRPNAESRAFEHAADLVRADAMRLAENLGPLGAAAAMTRFGESREWQLMKAIELYHFVNPKLLVYTTAVRRALENGPILAEGEPADGAEPGFRGIPSRMFPMEMVAEEPDDTRLADIFTQIKKTFSLDHINSDYRTLALWPEYLDAVWQRLEPLTRSRHFQEAADEVRQMARSMARTLPHTIPLSREHILKIGEDPDEILKVTKKFEELLAPLVLVIALLKRDWRAPQAIAKKLEGKVVGTPLPPPAGEEKTQWREAWREWQRKQHVCEVGDRYLSYVDEGKGDPVVMLHGMPTWSFLWHRLTPKLTDQYRVLAPDLGGFGFSDKSDRFDRSLGRQMTFLDNWFDSLRFGKVHLVAHDIGGGLALRLAAILPERVASLCLINSVCYDAWPIEAMLQLGHPEIYRKLSASAVLKLLRQALARGFASQPDEEELEGLLMPYATEVGKLSLIRDASALNTNLTTELTPLLQTIKVPTTVIWGADDIFLPIKYGERLAWDIPGARLVRVLKAGHFVMLDQPTLVAAQVRTHLDETTNSMVVTDMRL
ncbi:alpha/beta fold hydrolase [Verrucomicrobiota bacterium sgz303538]